MSELWFAAIHFGGFGALCALSFHKPDESGSRPGLHNAFNFFLAALSISVAVYLILFENALYARESEFIWTDFFFAGTSILLAMEFARRTSGWFMPGLFAFSLAYGLYLGCGLQGLITAKLKFAFWHCSVGMSGYWNGMPLGRTTTP